MERVDDESECVTTIDYSTFPPKVQYCYPYRIFGFRSDRKKPEKCQETVSQVLGLGIATRVDNLERHFSPFSKIGFCLEKSGETVMRHQLIIQRLIEKVD